MTDNKSISRETLSDMSDEIIDRIRILEACYERTGNPIFVWEAIPLCRVVLRTLPDWILDYLDDASQDILSGNGGGSIVKAIGISGRDIQKDRTLMRETKIAFYVWRKRIDGLSRWEAIQSAMNEFAKGEKAVEKAMSSCKLHVLYEHRLPKVM